MSEKSQFRVLMSPLSKTIFAGRVRQRDGYAESVGQRHDVTSDVLGAVIHYVEPGHVISVNESGAPAFEITVRDVRVERQPDPKDAEIARLSAALHETLAQLEEERARNAWQPIETAPKNGSVVDLWFGGEFAGRWADCYWGLPHHSCGEMGHLCDSEWHSMEDGWVDTMNMQAYGTPTHWRPLPAPPLAIIPGASA